MCVCVCVFLCLITVVPRACVCTYANTHVNKDEPICSTKYSRVFSSRVRLCEGQCMCNRARLRCHVRKEGNGCLSLEEHCSVLSPTDCRLHCCLYAVLDR